jgi:DNA mismatch endonuclease (patch repair protein)
VTNRLWLPYVVPDEVMSSPTTPAARTMEQDDAAGGRERRRVAMDDGGEATASVVLERFKRTRRVYAYLRFKYRSKNHRIYVGEASAMTRKEALDRAWRLVSEKGLIARPLPAPTRNRD